MDIFMTGATGYVGRAVALHLTGCGHRVAALARSPASAVDVARIGVRPVMGELGGPAIYAAEMRAAQAIVHTAFGYSADGAENSELDIAATRALLAAGRSGESRQFIYTSNAYVSQVSGEHLIDALGAHGPVELARAWRLGVEHEVLAAGNANFHTAVFRLGMVYGGCGGGTISNLFEAASRASVLPYLASACRNRWSLIHLVDLASLYGVILERGAHGVFHALDDHPVTVEAAFEAVAAYFGIPAVQAGESQVRAALDSHTVDIMQRDVALRANGSIALGWSPRFADLSAGLATAYDDWRQGVPS